jgi:hypothetical protein
MVPRVEGAFGRPGEVPAAQAAALTRPFTPAGATRTPSPPPPTEAGSSPAAATPAGWVVEAGDVPVEEWATAFLTREERAARRTRAEWPVHLYFPLVALLERVHVPFDRFAAWCEARRLVVPSHDLAADVEERSKRMAAMSAERDAVAKRVSAVMGRATAAKQARQTILQSPGVKLWGKVRSALAGDVPSSPAGR